MTRNRGRRVLGPSTTLAVGALVAACTSGNDIIADAGSSDSATGGDMSSGGDGADAGSETGSDSGMGTADGSLTSADGSAASDDGGADGSMREAGDAAFPMCGPFADGGTGLPDAGSLPDPTMAFFVSSQKNMTGNLGGLAGADARCQTLATAVGFGSKTWHAYVSVEHDASNGNGPTNARDRIGAGPWHNSRGALVAADLASLHSRTGDAAVFLDEHGNMINGQWTGSPSPVEHDILTGSNADGRLAVGKTCLDWTSAQPAADAGAPDGGELSVARVGHTDGFGPMCSTATTPNNLTSWNSAHDNAGCDNTAPRGGAGRIYCFATN